MPSNPDRLYELLPVIHRQRDAGQGYPLQALLRVIAEQVNLVEADIAQLYENWFIETAQEWVVPYIGDLIGYTPIHESGEPGDPATAAGQARNKILTPRREVANTLRYRRRKGTLALLEQLAQDVAGWPARAVEFYTLLSWMQNINLQHLERHRTVDVRDGKALDLLNGPFDAIAHTVDVRRINSTRARGRYNLPSVGLFVWRLKPYPVTRATTRALERPYRHCYTFSPLGNDAPLFARPEPERDPAHIADESNLPVPIRRRAFEQHPGDYYGDDKSLAIWADEALIPLKRIVAADLTQWRYRPQGGQVAVDPVRGRLAFARDQMPKHSLRVSYSYGFSADMGGGEYHRQLSQPVGATLTEVSTLDELQHALAAWQSMPDPAMSPRSEVIEITNSHVYMLALQLKLRPNDRLQIRAANGARPVLWVQDQRPDLPDAFRVELTPGSHITLDGLWITNRPVHIAAETQRQTPAACLGEVVIRHCTLVPGWGLEPDCQPKEETEPSLELENAQARVRIEHSIVGAIQVNVSQVQADPIPIHISDSILDATRGEYEALGAPGRPVAHAVLTIQRCTVFGIVQVHAIELAENTIFNDCLHVARRQLGCMRFCYVPADCRTPRRYHCQPDLVEQAMTSAADKMRERERVRPHFTDRRYGRPGYGQLAETCAEEIKRGADDDSEMGAFHHLYQPQREANLRARLAEYTPAGLNAGIIFAS